LSARDKGIFLTKIEQLYAPEKIIMASDDVRRVLWRMAHQVLEGHKGTADLVFIGIPTRGLPLALRLAAIVGEMEGENVPATGLDIGPYRDDLSIRGRSLNHSTSLTAQVKDRKVIIVDDVLFTGRSARAAMDALTDAGRPRQVELAVLVDRGHRELPIRPDYVGKNIPTSLSERVQVRLQEVDGCDEVALLRRRGE
jgi:pyrimidine operon attenuation protein/uracil phosphoribosyltransferase